MQSQSTDLEKNNVLLEFISLFVRIPWLKINDFELFAFLRDIFSNSEKSLPEAKPNEICIWSILLIKSD